MSSHDRDGNRLTDIWKGELFPHIGDEWQYYFDTNKKKRGGNL